MVEEKEITERKLDERVDFQFNLEQGSVKDMGEGSFSCVVSTSSIDRTNESIDTSGITTDTYMQNPVVLYGHDYSSLPIGKCISLKSFKNKLTATFQLAVNEYPFAKTVSDLIKGGYLNAVSIGGSVKAWSDDYTKILAMEMLEFSVVPVPANAQALITSRSLEEITGKSVDVIKHEYKDFVDKSLADKVAGIDNEELQDYIKSLKSLIAILETTVDQTSTKDTSKEESEKITLTLRKTAGQVSETGQKIIRLVKAKKDEK